MILSYASTCNSFSASYNTLNQITNINFGYDLAGNLANDGTYTYSYDAENRLTAAAGATYLYDALGRRVEKTTSGQVHYFYDASGNAAREENGSGSVLTDYLYMDGRYVAEYSGSQSYFIHRDHLGSTRLVTNYAGTECSSIDYMPFGEQTTSGTCTTTHRFTGKERDSESGLDNFGARYDSSQYGRFMTPDPSSIWLANLSDPQQLNLYSYVRNNPLSFTDPTGLDCVYLNDAGDGLDSVDHHSSQGECWNDNGGGGYWANGYVAESNSSIITDPNSDTIGIFSTDSAGNTGFSIATQNWTQSPGGWSTSMMYSPVPVGPDLTPPTDQQKLMAVKTAGAEASHDLGCATKAMAGSIPFAGHLFGGSGGDQGAAAIDEAGIVASRTGTIASGIRSYGTNLSQMTGNLETASQASAGAAAVEKYGPAVEEFAHGAAPFTLAVGVAVSMKDFNACVNSGGH